MREPTSDSPRHDPGGRPPGRPRPNPQPRHPRPARPEGQSPPPPPPRGRPPGPARAGITVRGHIDEEEAAAVLGLAAAAAAADGVFPLSEDVRLHLRYGGAPEASNLLLRDGGELAGFAHLGADTGDGERSGELTVHPGRRGHGLGLALARALVDAAHGAPVRVWAHGDLPAAARLAAAASFTRVRALWQMSRSLSGPLNEPQLPGGVTVRAFAPGRDEEAWLALNARAFAHHPEQAHWTGEDLGRREGEAWFDPAGFFLAERDGRLVGFHWTKIHSGDGPALRPAPGPAARRPAPATGEVYVIGVDAGERGSGLGRALTLIGLHYLRERGAPQVMLYVDESNSAAIRLYRSLGFTRAATDVMYRHGPG